MHSDTCQAQCPLTASGNGLQNDPVIRFVYLKPLLMTHMISELGVTNHHMINHWRRTGRGMCCFSPPFSNTEVPAQPLFCLGPSVRLVLVGQENILLVLFFYPDELKLSRSCTADIVQK